MALPHALKRVLQSPTMDRWEYAVLRVTLFREGNSNAPARELYALTLPGAEPASVTNTFGLPGVLNSLGAEGWELVEIENSAHYFKRRVR